MLIVVADRDDDAECGDGESALLLVPNSFTWSSPWVDEADEGEEEFEGPTMLFDM